MLGDEQQDKNKVEGKVKKELETILENRLNGIERRKMSEANLLKGHSKSIRAKGLSERTLVRGNTTKQQLGMRNKVEKIIKNLSEYLEEIENIEALNDQINAILLSTTQSNSVLTNAQRIRECKEQELWDPEDIVCKMIEESIEFNVDNAKRVEKIKIISDKYKELQDGILSKDTEKQNDVQKSDVHITLDDIQELSERIRKGLPLVISKIEGYIEFAKNVANEDEISDAARWISNIKGSLGQKLIEFEDEVNVLQEILVKDNLRIASHTKELKDVRDLKMTQMALKIDVDVNKLKERRNKMTEEELNKFEEMDKKWGAKKIKLKNAKKLKDISQYGEWKVEKRKGFWPFKSRGKKEEINDSIKEMIEKQFKSNAKEAIERLTDTNNLKYEINSLLLDCRQMNDRLSKLKTSNLEKIHEESVSKKKGKEKSFNDL